MFWGVVEVELGDNVVVLGYEGDGVAVLGQRDGFSDAGSAVYVSFLLITWGF